MKKLILCLSSVCMFATSSIAAAPLIRDITDEIPVIEASYLDGYQKIPNVAQYKNADWSNVVGIAKGVSIKEAKRIANEDSRISFFFYTKGYRMVLETEDGGYRVFDHGDAVFFAGNPWWGSAEDLADGYVKLDIDLE